MISIFDVAFEQTFTFREEATGKVTMWAVERALTWVRDHKRRKPVHIPIEDSNAEFIRANNGLEPHRLNRITAEQIKQHPILMAHMNDDTMLILDGSHRFVRAYDLGMEVLPGFVIKERELAQFEIGGLSEDFKLSMLSGFSGIA